jgi:hypothetical protein
MCCQSKYSMPRHRDVAVSHAIRIACTAMSWHRAIGRACAAEGWHCDISEPCERGVTWQFHESLWGSATDVARMGRWIVKCRAISIVRA